MRPVQPAPAAGGNRHRIRRVATWRDRPISETLTAILIVTAALEGHRPGALGGDPALPLFAAEELARNIRQQDAIIRQMASFGRRQPLAFFGSCLRHRHRGAGFEIRHYFPPTDGEACVYIEPHPIRPGSPAP